MRIILKVGNSASVPCSHQTTKELGLVMRNILREGLKEPVPGWSGVDTMYDLRKQ